MLIGRYEDQIDAATSGSVDACDVNDLISAQKFAKGWLLAMQQLQNEDLDKLTALTAASLDSARSEKRKLVHFEDQSLVDCSLMKSMSLHDDDRFI